jgi:hypothetical protein
LHGVTTVGFDPVTRLFGNQGGGDDPADVAFVHQVAIDIDGASDVVGTGLECCQRRHGAVRF